MLLILLNNTIHSAFMDYWIAKKDAPLCEARHSHFILKQAGLLLGYNAQGQAPQTQMDNRLKL